MKLQRAFLVLFCLVNLGACAYKIIPEGDSGTKWSGDPDKSVSFRVVSAIVKDATVQTVLEVTNKTSEPIILDAAPYVAQVLHDTGETTKKFEPRALKPEGTIQDAQVFDFKAIGRVSGTLTLALTGAHTTKPASRKVAKTAGKKAKKKAPNEDSVTYEGGNLVRKDPLPRLELTFPLPTSTY